jgi:hypothetical protein
VDETDDARTAATEVWGDTRQGTVTD